MPITHIFFSGLRPAPNIIRKDSFEIAIWDDDMTMTICLFAYLPICLFASRFGSLHKQKGAASHRWMPMTMTMPMTICPPTWRRMPITHIFFSGLRPAPNIIRKDSFEIAIWDDDMTMTICLFAYLPICLFASRFGSLHKQKGAASHRWMPMTMTI